MRLCKNRAGTNHGGREGGSVSRNAKKNPTTNFIIRVWQHSVATKLCLCMEAFFVISGAGETKTAIPN